MSADERLGYLPVLADEEDHTADADHVLTHPEHDGQRDPLCSLCQVEIGKVTHV